MIMCKYKNVSSYIEKQKKRAKSAIIDSVIICFPIALAMIVLKYAILKDIAFPIVENLRGGLSLSTWQKLTYLRSDLLWSTLLIPSLFAMLLFMSPRRSMRVVVSFLSAAACVFLFVQYKSFCFIGQFASLSLLYETAVMGNQYAAQYVSLLDVVLVFIFAGAPFLLPIIYARIKRNKEDRSELIVSNKKKNIALAALLLYVGFISAMWFPFSKFPTMPFLSSFHKNMLYHAITLSWTVPHRTEHPDVPDKNASSLRLDFFQMTHSNSHERESKYNGMARGANLLFFVMETVPYYAAKLDSQIGEFPTLQRLAKRSFIGINHYSTYPYTSRAVFSIYSGLYPSQENEDYISLYPGITIPGPISELQKLGYSTAIFLPDNPREFENEEALYRSIGFRDIRYPAPQDLPLSSWFNRNGFASLSAADLKTLKKLKQYLSEQLYNKKPFVVSFHPQLGHGPWQKNIDGMEYVHLTDRGKKIVQVQDMWLGEIVTLLEKHGVLNNTIIVVVADHGTRTMAEQPDLRPLLEETPFHVPFMLFVPQVLERPYVITDRTSHIDIAPTIATLMGFDSQLTYMQGVPIWNRDISKRTIYFLSGHYHGGNSYCSNGLFVSYNHRSNTLYAKNGSFNFDQSNIIDPRSAEFDQLLRPLNDFISFQNSYIASIHFEQAQAETAH